jgi:hypothetical protein
MFNNELFNKIRNVESTLDELLEFSSGRGRVTIDFFAKYYSLDSILRCISLYKDGKVSAQYLSEWAYCYSQVLTGCGTANEPYDYENKVSFKKLVENQILVLLADDLAEYHLSMEYYGEEDNGQVEFFEKLFIVFDEIYTDIGEWQPYYCLEEYEDDEGNTVLSGDAIVAFVNRGKKKFYQMMIDDLAYTNNKLEALELSYGAYCDHVEKLRETGYTEMLPAELEEFDEE